LSLWATGLWLLCCGSAMAHQLGIALISVYEEGPQQFQVQLKAPYDAAGRPPAIAVHTTNDCRIVQKHSHAEKEGVTRVWRHRCNGPIAGREFHISGLNTQTPDAVVVLYNASGEQTHLTLQRQQPSFVFSASAPPTLTDSSDYLPMGIEHILGGYDHLLLVFLFWLMARGKQLLWVVTSFTLAHSITLALAVTDAIALPSLVVESMIAFSITLLAAELLRQHRDPAYESFTLQKPAVMAFAFGLLHGLGFAGALSEAGLPSEAFWPVLLLFNLGVETGQLLFVAALIIVSRISLAVLQTSIAAQALPNLKPPILFSIGGLSAFWFFSRVLAF
ncbi:MAG: HupE/UreJ family protein, partial [Gammaproteobacteria bacterium]|nr:HupE/UreJ family protein [Gammaproteobacteria bacterium]